MVKRLFLKVSEAKLGGREASKFHHNLPPMDYTPSSYFSKKKIRVTALREFSEVVPDFRKMHNNIRIHLGQEGVESGGVKSGV